MKKQDEHPQQIEPRLHLQRESLLLLDDSDLTVAQGGKAPQQDLQKSDPASSFICPTTKTALYG